MNSFSEFDIKPAVKPFSGEKIDVQKLLNVEIVIEAFKVEPSKYKKDECLYMQIRHKGEQRVIFIGSKYLIQMIRQVPVDKFPFKATIISENKTLLFK